MAASLTFLGRRDHDPHRPIQFPFVRRVGIALTLYGMPFEHRPWSTFGDADKIRPYNPLTRVPTLVLDDGEVLIESHIMLDYLDSLVPAERAHVPVDGAGAAQGAQDRGARDRARPTRQSASSTKRRLHKEVSETWVERCRMQIETALAVLEADRAGRKSDYWFGDRIGHADIAVVDCAALHRRGACRVSSRWRIFRRSNRACGKARGAAGVQGDQPAVHPAVVRLLLMRRSGTATPVRLSEKDSIGS